jgi:WD40 repeat protein
MPLALGERIGPYEVLAPIGAGGMGEVYRARDTKLKREVALKVLPEAFARDPGRLARFQREAEVLASLNHPNIAHIYGVEDRALVMELVEGDSPKGPLPFEEAWKVMLQIADALEYAHERGVIHRDLKPANVKVTSDGVVKLLDFGLAKAYSDAPEASGSDPANSPTVTLGATIAGTIMGTAAYMAPEQAKGKKVDKRADIWSWGVVLYELLTGERMFKGEDVADTLAQVLTKDPDLERVPSQVRKLLRRCLEKDPKQRLRDIGEVRFGLDAEPLSSMPVSLWSWPGLGWVVAGAMTIALAASSLWLLHPRAAELKQLRRLNVDLGPDAVAGVSTTVAISPDGTRIVFPVRSEDGKQRLATRLLDQAKETLLGGTEDGKDPFFSPDGQWIGFFALGKMKKISVLGGAPVTLCDAANNPRGASWGEDGYIVANLASVGGLSRIPDAGGTPEPVTKLEGEIAHRWPQVLPEGRGVLFTGFSRSSNQELATIRVWLPETKTVKTVLQNGYFGRFVSKSESGDDQSGYLLYIHEGTLFAVPFDLNGLEMRGKPVPALEDIASDVTSGGAQFGFSRDGTLIYIGGTVSDSSTPLAWLDSSGKSQPLLEIGHYRSPRLSPDGQSLAVSGFSGGTQDIYVYDLQRQTMRRLTFTPTADSYPTWTPDGKYIAFGSAGNSLRWIRADGSGEPQELLAKDSAVTTTVPYSFSPDGRRLSYYHLSPETGGDIWTMTLDLTDPDHPKPGKPEPFLRTKFNEGRGAFSPDGRWMAYESDESGMTQLYVQPFPGPGGKWQISNAGGRYATWSRDGEQLFFETLDGYIMVANYTVKGGSFIASKPRQWSTVQVRDVGSLNMTLHPDGKRFVIVPVPVKAADEKGANLHATFLLNFTDELRRRMPKRK